MCVSVSDYSLLQQQFIRFYICYRAPLPPARPAHSRAPHCASPPPELIHLAPAYEYEKMCEDDEYTATNLAEPSAFFCLRHLNKQIDGTLGVRLRHNRWMIRWIAVFINISVLCWVNRHCNSKVIHHPSKNALLVN